MRLDSGSCPAEPPAPQDPAWPSTLALPAASALGWGGGGDAEASLDGRKGGGSDPRPGRRGCSHSWQLGTAGPHPCCGRAAERSPKAGPAMARDRPPGRGCSPLSRCLLGAALLLGLRLCAELRRAGPRPPARSAPPRPPAPHLPPAPGPARGASRRQVTYVRSGRRAPPGGGGSGTRETGCCAQRARPRRKVSGKRAPWAVDPTPRRRALGSGFAGGPTGTSKRPNLRSPGGSAGAWLTAAERG